MFIYSGEYRFCEVGRETTLKDDAGNKLRTGDIVIAYTFTNDFGFANFDNLTVVVANDYRNIRSQEPVKKDELGEPFVMGIKNVNLEEESKKYPDGVWMVRRVKKYEDVIDGEHWKDFGFSFSIK